VDNARVAALLSQFNGIGDLTGVVREAQAHKSKVEGSTLEFSGNAAIAKAVNKLEAGNDVGHSEARQDMYDPRWVKTLQFLDESEQRGILKRDLDGANLGDLVVSGGAITIRDMGLIEKLWQTGAFTELMGPSGSGNRAERRAGKGKASSPLPTELKLFLELAKIMPHSTQFTITGSHKIWGILEEQALLSAVSDFVLKYGTHIAGDWTVIGVLDARPDQYTGHTETPSSFSTPAVDEIIELMLAGMVPLVRQLLGRPANAYGVTPLVIMREIGQ
jgi:hypothetical protein